MFKEWVEGREAAIGKNWQDRSNYLNDAFQQAIFAPSVGKQQLEFEKGKLGLFDSSLESALKYKNYPTYATLADTTAANAGDLAELNVFMKKMQPLLSLAYLMNVFNGGMGTGSGIPGLGSIPSILSGGNNG